MSKYNYYSVHDLKDLAMIYNDCDDYAVKVWDAKAQREGEIYFTGSSNTDKEVNFNIRFKEDVGLSVLDAFKEVMDAIENDGFSTKTKKEWEALLLTKMLKHREEKNVNEDKHGTKISMEVGNKKMEWSTPHDDEPIENIINAFYACLIGQTWLPETVLESMKEFAEDNLDAINYKPGIEIDKNNII